MNQTHLYIPRSPSGRQRAALGLPALLLAGAVLAASAATDMYQPRVTPGGISPQPQITGFVKQGTNATLSLYGLEAPRDTTRANADLNKYQTDASIVWKPYLVSGSSEADKYGGRQGCPGSNFEWEPVFPKSG